MSQAMTAANPIAQKSGSSGSTPSPARVAADHGVTTSAARAEDCAGGALMGVALRTAVAAAAPPATNGIEIDKAFDRGEPAADPGSAANPGSVACPGSLAAESVFENARGNNGTFQFGEINMANGSSAPLTRAA
jgi:hypothetical protein